VQGRQVPLDVFVGRAAERARVAEVLTRVEAGQPWLVTIEGNPGIGKTALARRCLAQASGVKVLSARGDQTETDLDFGVVDQLLRAAGGAAPTVSLTGGAGPAVSSFAVGAHLLEVVGGQQATGAVALVVDDLQWADRRSVEALTFMLRRLSVDTVLAVMVYRGPGDRLGEATQRMLRSVENRLDIPLSGLGMDEVAALTAALTANRPGSDAIRWLYEGTGGHPLYLRTVLSDGSGFDPQASGPRALPRSLAAVVDGHLRALPPQTRSIVELLSVLNLRVPLAQLGETAQIDSPAVLIEPAVAAGLVDWWPEEPTCPVEIGHQLVRDAIYADITAARRRLLHAQAASLVSESVSWEHRVAALDRPDEGLAAELEQLAATEAAGFRLILAATHLRWASDISPARADRERRLLTAALYLADEAQGAALRPAVE
jgi:predicted ATPase